MNEVAAFLIFSLLWYVFGVLIFLRMCYNSKLYDKYITVSDLIHSFFLGWIGLFLLIPFTVIEYFVFMENRPKFLYKKIWPKDD